MNLEEFAESIYLNLPYDPNDQQIELIAALAAFCSDATPSDSVFLLNGYLKHKQDLTHRRFGQVSGRTAYSCGADGPHGARRQGFLSLRGLPRHHHPPPHLPHRLTAAR